MKRTTLHLTAALCGLFLACAAQASECDVDARDVRAANERLRSEIFHTHPPHPRGALALAELKRSDQLLDQACRKGSAGNEVKAAGFAHRQARDRLAGRLPASI